MTDKPILPAARAVEQEQAEVVTFLSADNALAERYLKPHHITSELRDHGGIQVLTPAIAKERGLPNRFPSRKKGEEWTAVEKYPAIIRVPAVDWGGVARPDTCCFIGCSVDDTRRTNPSDMVNRISWVGNYAEPQGITYHESYIKALNGAGALPDWAHGGLNGIRGYHKGDGAYVDNLLPDLPPETLAALPCVLVPDSNYHDNVDVRQAFGKLAQELRAHFKAVSIAPIPKRQGKDRDASDLHPEYLADVIQEATSTGHTEYGEAMAALQAHRPQSVQALENPPPMRPHLIEGKVPSGVVGGLTGEGNVGKTTFQLYMESCIAAGIPFLGKFKVNDPGTVVHLMGEEDQITADNMKSAVARALVDSLPEAQRTQALHDIATKLHVISLRGLTADLAVQDSKANVRVSEWVDNFIEWLGQYDDLRLVSLDTLATFEGVGTDANNHAAKVVIRAMERISVTHGCNVFAPSHTSQAAAQNRVDDMHAARGATSLVYNSKANYRLRVIYDDSGNNNDNAEVQKLGFGTTNPVPPGTQLLKVTPSKVNTLTPAQHAPFYMARVGYTYSLVDFMPTSPEETESHQLREGEEETFYKVIREVDAMHDKGVRATASKLADGNKTGVNHRKKLTACINRYEALGLARSNGKSGHGADIEVLETGRAKYLELRAKFTSKAHG